MDVRLLDLVDPNVHHDQVTLALPENKNERKSSSNYLFGNPFGIFYLGQPALA